MTNYDIGPPHRRPHWTQVTSETKPNLNTNTNPYSNPNPTYPTNPTKP